MPTPPTPLISVADSIVRFKSATELAHQFTKGDSHLTVVGEDGNYPSLAKLAADSQVFLEQQWQLAMPGVIMRSYRFNATDTLRVQHWMGSQMFSVIIINSSGQHVYAPTRPIDDNEFVVEFTEPEGGIIHVTFYRNI